MPYRGYKARSLVRSKPPTRREILAAVPPGSVRLRGPQAGRRWLDALSAFCPELAGLYANARETHLEFARLLAGRVSWADGTTFHSREARCEAAGRGETAWKVFRRHLETWGDGWLGTVRPGRIYYLPDTGETRHDAAIYVICLPRSVVRKIAAWRRAHWPFLKSRPPTGEPTVSNKEPRAACSDQHGRDGPPSGRPQSPGRPRNAELTAGGAAAGAMADALRRAAGQDLTDGWCGWFARRYLAAGWTPAELAEALARIPARQHWDYVLRTLPPQVALMFWLRSSPAEHWALDWYAMRAGPARARAREVRADQLEQRRQRAAAAAAAGRPAGIGEELARARAAMRQASKKFRAAARGGISLPVILYQEGLTMTLYNGADASKPGVALPPMTSIIAGYIGDVSLPGPPDTPHIWTAADWNLYLDPASIFYGGPGLRALPIYTHDYPGDPVADADNAVDAALELGWAGDRGRLIAWDSEGLIDPPYMIGLMARLRTRGFRLLKYGIERTVMQDPPADGGAWVAALQPRRPAYLPSFAVGQQWAFGESWDLNVFDQFVYDNCGHGPRRVVAGADQAAPVSAPADPFPAGSRPSPA